MDNYSTRVGQNPRRQWNEPPMSQKHYWPFASLLSVAVSLSHSEGPGGPVLTGHSVISSCSSPWFHILCYWLGWVWLEWKFSKDYKSPSSLDNLATFNELIHFFGLIFSPLLPYPSKALSYYQYINIVINIFLTLKGCEDLSRVLCCKC